jgi:hypothetical protein
MAQGDQTDFTSRILRLLPTGWFPSAAPRLNAVLQGAASSLSAAFAMLTFVKAQTRVGTATGSFLDLISQGYFAGKLPRLAYESDASYIRRILYNLTAPRGTWDGMAEMLELLTGNEPIIFQPNRVASCGCLASRAQPNIAGPGSPMQSRSGLTAPYPAFGYQNPANEPVVSMGSLLLPCQVFIIIAPPTTGYAIYAGDPGFATRTSPSVGGNGGMVTLASPDIAGSGIPLVDPDSLPGEVTANLIYQFIADWMPVGYTAWVLVSNQRIY